MLLEPDTATRDHAPDPPGHPRLYCRAESSQPRRPVSRSAAAGPQLPCAYASGAGGACKQRRRHLPDALDPVGAREQRLIADQRVMEEPLVRGQELVALGGADPEVEL